MLRSLVGSEMCIRDRAYPVLMRPRGRPVVALMVDNTEMGLETLAAKGFSMITEGDLDDDET